MARRLGAAANCGASGSTESAAGNETNINRLSAPNSAELYLADKQAAATRFRLVRAHYLAWLAQPAKD
jgi:hypothetical protein